MPRSKASSVIITGFITSTGTFKKATTSSTGTTIIESWPISAVTFINWNYYLAFVDYNQNVYIFTNSQGTSGGVQSFRIVISSSPYYVEGTVSFTNDAQLFHEAHEYPITTVVALIPQ